MDAVIASVAASLREESKIRREMREARRIAEAERRAGIGERRWQREAEKGKKDET